MPVQKREDQKHEAYTLPSGRTVVFVKSPHGDNHEVRHARNVLQHVLTMTSVAEAAQSDPMLSAVGRAGRIKPAVEAARKAIAEQRARMQALATGYTKIESDLLAIPKLEPGDAVGAINEAEAARWYRSLPDDQRGRLLAEMQQGGNDAMLTALARSPIPDLHAQAAQSIHRARIAAANPQTLELLANNREELASFDATMRSCEAAVAEQGAEVDKLLQPVSKAA